MRLKRQGQSFHTGTYTWQNGHNLVWKLLVSGSISNIVHEKGSISLLLLSVESVLYTAD